MSWQERLSSKMNRTSWKTAHEDYHPHIDDENDLQSHLMSHHQGDFVGDMDDHEWFHSDPSDYNVTHKLLWGFPVENHDPDHYHSNDHKYEEVPNELPKSFASFTKKSEPSTLRGEGIPAFTEPSYQDDQDEDDQVVGPQDLDSNATTVDKFPKSVGVFKNSSWKIAAPSEFGEPLDYNENRMQDVEDTSRLQSRFPLDTGKRDYAEQRQDANPLTLRSWFTGDDVNGPWPHTKNLSGPLDFEPTDNQNEDSTGPVMSSYNSRYAHEDKHPWPNTNDELANHLSSHHPKMVQLNSDYWRMSIPTVIEHVRQGHGKAFEAHIKAHKQPEANIVTEDEKHEHDDDFHVDIPDNIETIAPTYITSSWHEAFVDVIPTNPDEETEDSLLNPADELKNGRPRANDLPQQSAQLIPGMLIDHDQMGGSGTSSAGF